MQDIVIKSIPKPKVMQLSLNRPRQRNALSNEMIARLAGMLEEEWDSDEVRCCILVGADNVFSAGADIKEMQPNGYVDVLFDDFIGQWDRLTLCRKPVIAAVAGYALGGGCELAMMCDFIIAAEYASPGDINFLMK